MAAPTTTSPKSPTFCRGYILAHQHPTQVPNSQIDPYAVIPCPHDVQIPKTISERCKESTGARVCWRAKYCEMHWCGGCKKVNGVGRAAKVDQVEGDNKVVKDGEEKIGEVIPGTE